MEEQGQFIEPYVLQWDNEEKPPRYAGLLIRALASFADCIAVGCFIVLPLVLLVYLVISGSYGDKSLVYPLAIFVILAAIAGCWIYEAGFVSSKYRATPGKMLCGLQVTDLEGKRVTFGKATIRFVVKSLMYTVLSEFIHQCLGGLYFLADSLIMFTNDKRQCLHDMVAGTVVIHAE